MAMLALAAAAFPGKVMAATVDHGLRPANAEEAATVARWCAEAGVAHSTLTVVVPPSASDNLQSWARQERYTLLRRWAAWSGADAICTAHHADDQAETFLMRANRASGVAGLAGIRARQRQDFAISAEPTLAPPGAVAGWTMEMRTILLLRPLLGWRRAKLQRMADALALPYSTDPSNTDPRFDRTRFREWLSSAPWIDPVAIGRSAAHLAEVDADLSALARWLWKERAVAGPIYEAALDLTDLPREVRRRLVRVAITAVRDSNGISQSDFDESANVEPLLDALETGRSATQAGVVASADGQVWRFREAPPRRG